MLKEKTVFNKNIESRFLTSKNRSTLSSLFPILILSLFTLFLSTSNTLAEWPTEPMTGVELIDLENTTDSYTIDEFELLSNGSMAIVLKKRTMEDDFYQYLRVINLDGTLTCPSTDDTTGLFDNCGADNKCVQIVEGLDESIFVTWLDYRGAFWVQEAYSYDRNWVYVQKLSLDLQPLWGSEGVSTHEELFWYDDFALTEFRFLVPQIDGGAICIYDPYSNPIYYQQHDTNGNRLIDAPGAFLINGSGDIRPSSKYDPILDGSGGILFFRGGGAYYLQPDGSFAWDPGSITEANTELLRFWQFEDGQRQVSGIADSGTPNYWSFKTNYSFDADTMVLSDLNPTERFVSESVLDNDSFGAIRASTTYMRYDREFNELLPSGGIELDLGDRLSVLDLNYLKYKVGIGGSRFGCREPGSASSANRYIRGFDVDGNFDFEHPVYQSQGYGAEALEYKIDKFGNTWVMWSERDPVNAAMTTYVNIIGPDGSWGQPVTSSADGENPESNLPELITLSSFPNPFNSTTTITIDLKTIEMVTIKIFDMLGRHVTTLLSDASLSSGQHSVIWDTEQEGMNPPLASGVYFVRATTESGHRFTTRVQHIK
jgi:Secretion system C-terminal sorting domain